jgi:hypothetical protein
MYFVAVRYILMPFGIWGGGDECILGLNVALIFLLPKQIVDQAGLPDFTWYNTPKWEKYTKMATKYTKWP